MKPRTIALISAMSMLGATAVPIGLLAQNSREQVRYSLTDLGTLGGTFSIGHGINDKGWVLGFSTLPGDQETRATLWVQGRKIDLGTLGGANSEAFYGPSDSGWVAGSAETSTPDPLDQQPCFYGSYLTCLPFVWRDGVMTALPTLGGSFGNAFNVNNLGQVVGAAASAAPDPTCAGQPIIQGFQPVLWKNGHVLELPTIAGDPDGLAAGINDKGQAVGGTGNCAQANNLQTTHAVLWENGAATDLGSLGGTTYSFAENINNLGQVVGVSNISGDTTSHAFLRQNGVMTDLGTLAGDSFSDAHWINDNGQVVGLSCDTNGNCRAFRWQNGVMTDINELTHAGSPLYALEALEINMRGEIVGYGLQLSTGDIHAFLATPLAGENVGASIAPGVRNDASQSVKNALPQNVREFLQRRAIFGGRSAIRNP